MAEPYTPAPLIVLRLRGTQAEMGAQQGKLLVEAGGWEQAVSFYPRMASAMLSLAIPRAVRGPARRALQVGLTLGARRLHRARRGHFPAYAARTDALLAAAGLDPRLGRALAVMDVFQNTVGGLGRWGLLAPTGMQVAAVPACTSLAVWGQSSADGALRHARNFDFPGAGVWDRAPALVFCDPDEGLRYGFVTTRGADVPVTVFNEAGLSVSAHTRFHRDINFDGVSVVDYGHEIARRCRTLAEVRELVAPLRTASSWGFLVSSAAEQSALLIETSGEAVRFIDPRPGEDHLAQTNRYRDDELAEGEVTSSPSFALDSDARFRRADEAVERLGALDRDDLEALLGDTGDPHAPDPEAYDRLGGNCIVSAMTVQSVIFEPEAGRVRMSVGSAPTGLGPWVDIAHAWDGPVERVEHEATARDEDQKGGEGRGAGQRAAMRYYVTATRAHLDGQSAVAVLGWLERAVDATPSEPNYRFLAAMFAISSGQLERARAHLERALEREHGSYRRALCLLWYARVLAADGRLAEARAAWRELARVPETEATAPLMRMAARESIQPLRRARLRTLVPDIFLVDAVLPGI